MKQGRIEEVASDTEQPQRRLFRPEDCGKVSKDGWRQKAPKRL